MAKLILKSLLAVLALSALAVVAGRSLSPGTPALTVLAYAALLGVAVLFGVIMCVIMGGHWNQFTLRAGGTDAAWMKWGGEPPGLTALRGLRPTGRAAQDNGECRDDGPR